MSTDVSAERGSDGHEELRGYGDVLEDVRIKLSNQAGCRKPIGTNRWTGRVEAAGELKALERLAGDAFPQIQSQRDMHIPEGVDARGCIHMLRQGTLNSNWSEERKALCPPFTDNQLSRLHNRSRRAHRQARGPQAVADPLPTARVAISYLEMVRVDVDSSYSIKRRRARKKYLRAATQIVEANLILAKTDSAPVNVFRVSFALSSGLLRCRTP